MIGITNGDVTQYFCCHQEIIDFFDEETFESILDNTHPIYTMFYI